MERPSLTTPSILKDLDPRRIVTTLRFTTRTIRPQIPETITIDSKCASTLFKQRRAIEVGPPRQILFGFVLLALRRHTYTILPSALGPDIVKTLAIRK